MALRALLMTMMMAAVVAPSLGMDYIVGDESGWKLDYNYTAWVWGKDFRVGDNIMFMYIEGAHNVVTVNGTDFKSCTSSNATAVPLTSGNDTITLSSPGNKWYICGVGDHCKRGMKLVITVGAEAPAPTPVP